MLDESSCSDDAGVASQAVDILAGLASLGISQSLRDQVHRALADISQAAGIACDTQLQSHAISCPSRQASGYATDKTTYTSTSGSRDYTLQRKVAELEQKMSMSRSIMKKLYHKNVELEKELAIIKANRGVVDLSPPPTAHGNLALGSFPADTAASRPGQIDSTPASQALQERDLTIRQLQQALEASRRRCALLEMQLANGAGGGAGTSVASGSAAGKGGGGGMGATGVSPDSLRDMLAQSALHHQKYKQIREDYNRLLNKRASALQAGSRSGSAAAVAARAIVEDLQKRLAEEVQEREAEAALYSAKLYQSEKAMSDWYVEKRLLEDHITRLSAELAERDKIDGEIEGCVTSMLERLRAVEAENEELRGRFTAGTAAPAGQCA
ncbi:hypothetical protein Vretimale_3381 [Volvox reticuliferus]|uniref:Uncharacterized protein n=2 Tax=Volvox reticuliferus TaxID=1737510 RepID=A0A8J4BXK4_9CHLO|nr:hypothetical protein Vretifemale_868 [Volvox reticuliferus]GIL97833.1 hypothetical protein Vretimale_3381 [Volvox reticuliferus]